MAAFGAPQAAPQAPDYKCPAPMSDGISSLSLSNNNLLVATSFDSSVRCYQVQQQGQQVAANAVAEVKSDGPVLCSDFDGSGSAVYFAGAGDNTAKMWQPGQPTAQTIGRHEKPIKCIQYVQMHNGLVITGGWDNSVKFWDTRQPNPIQSITVAQRVYAMDIRSPLMVVATADVPAHERQQNSPELRYVYTFNLQTFQHSTQPHSMDPSPLKHQTRCIATFPDQTGYAIGSIEGRVAIQHVDASKKDKNFAFKCHRQSGQQLVQGKQTSEVYAVNAIAFHPLGTFATAGSDGVFNFWDKDSKQRLKNFPRCNGSISAAKFSPSGNLFAYSVSYDWSKGREYYQPQAANDIFLHPVEASEVQPRPVKKQGVRGR
mmetsp:Transcript_58215/g.161320  ORF Transcript_58215/g.161320 Transcript_58215/m.161320 type:complete len:373 (+) Transcript_58215:97-1215(+)